MCFHTVLVKGDWKFLRQSLNFERHYGAESICYYCEASKGNHVRDMNFTDLSPDAGWRETIFSCPPPWTVLPALAKLRFFEVKMVSIDLLHAWHLGVARDLTLGCYFNMFFFGCFVFVASFLGMCCFGTVSQESVDPCPA